MRPVMVVGPHRSGTSVTTQVVSALGPSLCDEDDRMVPDPSRLNSAQADNPKGHWESRSLTDFDDELLAHLGGTWAAPPEPLPSSDLTARLRSHRSEAVERFRRVHPQQGWVWKDPRLCLLLPFWTQALEVEPLVVLVVRQPQDIAASLVARNGLGPAHALALWERYAGDMLRHCAGLRVVVVRYDRLLDDTAGQVRRLRDALVRHGAAVCADATALAKAAEAADPSLRHHEGLPRAEGLSPSQNSLARLVNSLGAGYDAFPHLEAPPPDTAATELLRSHRQAASALRVAAALEATVCRLEEDLRALSTLVKPADRLPTLPCRNRSEFMAVHQSELFARRYKLEVLIAKRHQRDEHFTLPGTCLVCGQLVDFKLDWLYAHPPIDARWLNDNGAPLELRIPNWRERMLCPGCGMNNRQRAIAAKILDAIREQGARLGRTPRVYLTEQVTPMFRFFTERVPEAACVGSEFLDPDLAPGASRDGLRHEDVEHLSFSDATFDLVVSCSVLEHVNEPLMAVSEMVRILRPGGELFLEIPFDVTKERSVRRARRLNGNVEHLLPAQYHGDPMSSDGSLVYTDFGWEFFDQLRCDTSMTWKLIAYWDMELGHLGGAQFFFHGRRR